MEIGPFIKLHRIKQGMTQGDLAEGIVSESYLSKIENGKTIASQDVTDLLCTRLGVQFMDELNPPLNEEKFQEWFGMLFEINSKQAMKERYEELQQELDASPSDLQIMFEIHKVRYYLIIDEAELALRQINYLKDLSHTFNSNQQYYWFKFNGNYNSVIEEFNQAIRFYKLAEEKVLHTDVSEDEFADLKYTIAVTHSKLRNTLEVIEYANQALETHRKNYNFFRCAQGHILLGISYRRIRIYDKAIKNYNLAHHLAQLNKNEKLIQLTNHNLGYLHSAKGDVQQAIHYFRLVIEDEQVTLENRLNALTSIVKEYYELENYEQAKEMVDLGMQLIQGNTSGKYLLFYYKLKTYLFALEEKGQEFEKLVIDKFLPYLKKQKDHANLVVYANMIGKYYEDLKKYKAATQFYKLANITYEQLIKI